MGLYQYIRTQTTAGGFANFPSQVVIVIDALGSCNSGHSVTRPGMRMKHVIVTVVFLLEMKTSHIVGWTDFYKPTWLGVGSGLVRIMISTELFSGVHGTSVCVAGEGNKCCTTRKHWNTDLTKPVCIRFIATALSDLRIHPYPLKCTILDILHSIFKSVIINRPP